MSDKPIKPPKESSMEDKTISSQPLDTTWRDTTAPQVLDVEQTICAALEEVPDLDALPDYEKTIQRISGKAFQQQQISTSFIFPFTGRSISQSIFQ